MYEVSSSRVGTGREAAFGVEVRGFIVEAGIAGAVPSTKRS
jgi:hypothetical protein